MDFFVELLMDIIPEALAEWFTNRWGNAIKRRVRNPVLQKILIVSVALLAIIVAVGVALAVVAAVVYIIYK